MADFDDRKRRKEEGKRRKRQRIEDSGGTRPRNLGEHNNEASNDARARNGHVDDSNAARHNVGRRERHVSHNNHNNHGDRRIANRNEKRSSGGPRSFVSPQHRFGRVMETVPCRNKPRFSTLSIAIPGSVLSNCQTRELRTLLVGQIARAATIYHVDEIVVFDDKLGKSDNRDSYGGGQRRPPHRDQREKNEKSSISVEQSEGDHDKSLETRHSPSDPQTFMARILQYCECPQYLRRHFFPMHPDLQFAGLLAPVDAPHHVRAEDRSKYREGVVLDKRTALADGGSLVNCGVRNRPVE